MAVEEQWREGRQVHGEDRLAGQVKGKSNGKTVGIIRETRGERREVRDIVGYKEGELEGTRMGGEQKEVVRGRDGGVSHQKAEVRGDRGGPASFPSVGR